MKQWLFTLVVYYNHFENESESCSDVSHSLQPHGLYSPWNSLGQNTGAFPSPEDLPNPRIKPKSLALLVDSLSNELSGKHTSLLVEAKGAVIPKQWRYF